ncbi:hypothetical protein chiPu_0013598 [Chiloscyllium punctatum]|uniref:Uncharacterized protein n=1 Tax=Chiloscyllium punctatum TaxID=137246 RepID=A0A401SXI1_CHIPU|nr:hypothetical protein [Chiloscyllium punctatum]
MPDTPPFFQRRLVGVPVHQPSLTYTPPPPVLLAGSNTGRERSNLLHQFVSFDDLGIVTATIPTKPMEP